MPVVCSMCVCHSFAFQSSSRINRSQIGMALAPNTKQKRQPLGMNLAAQLPATLRVHCEKLVDSLKSPLTDFLEALTKCLAVLQVIEDCCAKSPRG